MDILLFLFIFPIATIIFAIALQKILCNPYLVSAIVLAIFLIVTFTVYGVSFLIAAFIYAIIALVTAYIVSIFCRISNRSIEINFIGDNGSGRAGDNNSSCCNNCNNSRTGEGRCSSCNNGNARSGSNRSGSNCCNGNNGLSRNLACFNENVVALSNSIDELADRINAQNDDNDNCSSCNSNNDSQNRNGNNCNCGCGTLRNGDPNTTACRTCACQRQFRNCLRRV